MAVLKCDQVEAEREYFGTAIALRKEITMLLLRDFGIKNKIRTIDAISDMKKMDEKDKETFHSIAEKYGMTSMIEEYPDWLIKWFREEIMRLLDSLIYNITQAYNNYPYYEREYYDRRSYQNQAIGDCKALLQKMQHVIYTIPVDANKYMRYVDMITKEIELLKLWRKKDNSIIKKIKEREQKTT